MGSVYVFGIGVETNYAEAEKWLLTVANNGTDIRVLNGGRAEFMLGKIYMEGGYGISENKTEAIKWYKCASEYNSEASYLLGKACEKGRGVERSLPEAIKWYRKADERGWDERARYRLGYLYENGIGVDRDFVEAAKWYRKAAHGDGG